MTVALDAKVQVDWDVENVERYRLIGFENRAVDDEQFRDDSVEAGAIGAGHSVTALYELKLHEDAAGTLGTVTLRWTDPETREPVELVGSLEEADLAPTFAQADRSFRLAATAAAFGEVLRESYWATKLTLFDVATEAAAREEEFPGDEAVHEFADLTRQAAALADR